ncbi:MAG: DUF1684 domain-containing protein [Frankiaceae bacterium]
MSVAVLDWRRRVLSLYAEVRAAPTPAEGHAHWVAVRNELLRTHPASPVPAAARPAYEGAPHAPYDPALRFEVPIETGGGPDRFEVLTGTDGLVAFDRIGRVTLPGLGTLDVWWHAGYGGGAFVPMRDTSPRTYGGGRYVLDTVKGADLGGDVDPASGAGRLVIDLNFAYNPSCAYDPAWACPLAPEGNRLGVPVHAGELYVPS